MLKPVIPEAESVWQQLQEGNQRFRSGRGSSHVHTPEEIRDLAKSQHPIAAIIACSDSRVTPEIVFDQPLGSIFASRVPGNVASDSAKWMLELAVGEFKVPLVMVMGHTGCLAVGQLLDGDKGGAGGLHRFSVLSAVYRAKQKRGEDLYRASIEENVLQTVEHLARDLVTLRRALLEKKTSIMGSVYNMESGAVEAMETKVELYGVY
jgi:carbonic anhydrase